jgi:uncharacterized membrane protein
MMSRKVKDALLAHLKLLPATITAVVPHTVDSETFDLVFIGIGLLVTWLTPNDEDAKERIYGKRRR